MTDLPEIDGVINSASRFPVTQALDRLEESVRSRGMTVFARIDQQAAAEGVGLTLRPTQLLIFGDPHAGTPLMNAFPSLALELPLKVLAWEAEDGQVWLSYNSPEYLQQRHHLPHPPFQAVVALIAEAGSGASERE